MSEFRDVRLPADMCAAVEKAFAGKFESLEELLTFVLKELSSEDALQADETEQQVIEERLRELGYI